MKTESTVMYVLRLALTLLAITAVVAAALAGVNSITAPAIAELNAQKTQEAIELVLPGGGAAGGMGAGMAAFFGGQLKSGIDTLLDAVDFDTLVKEASLIFTGEGKLDGQTAHGKAICGIAKRAKPQNVPVIALVGGSEGDLSALHDAGLTAVFSINRLPQPLEQSGPHGAEYLEHTMDNVLRLLEVGR